MRPARKRESKKGKETQIEREEEIREYTSSQLVVAMPSLQESMDGKENMPSRPHAHNTDPPPFDGHLVELLRVKNCTPMPEPADRRRSKTRDRTSLALPLRRLRESSSEPRRRLWSKRTFSR